MPKRARFWGLMVSLASPDPSDVRPVAVVTGASRGIGAAIARRLARDGYRLALTARGHDALIALQNDLGSEDVFVMAGDVADTAFVQSFYQAVQARFGRIDVLVANAGQLANAPLGLIAPEMADKAFDVNVLGVLSHMQMAARFMRRTKQGAMILMGSIIGTQGGIGQTVYAATKAALVGMALSAVKELGPDGITVNVIAPGMIDTDMLADLSDAKIAARLEQVALRRVGQPQEVADLVSFLASDKARYITGQVIGIDGGMVI